jgi:intraflagellar transport protein 140
MVNTVTDFCFNLAAGDIESVIKTIKLIKSDHIWINLANVCIKMRKMKLARMCFGKLKNAKALRTIGLDRKDKYDIKLAPQYALHLGKPLLTKANTKKPNIYGKKQVIFQN